MVMLWATIETESDGRLTKFDRTFALFFRLWYNDNVTKGEIIMNGFSLLMAGIIFVVSGCMGRAAPRIVNVLGTIVIVTAFVSNFLFLESLWG